MFTKLKHLYTDQQEKGFLSNKKLLFNIGVVKEW